MQHTIRVNITLEHSDDPYAECHYSQPTYQISS